MSCHDAPTASPRPAVRAGERGAAHGDAQVEAVMTVALAGNPNTGKSTVFNALTGGRQHVGNWPGKTVERAFGTWRYDGRVAEVVDLPGTYSLSAYSTEEGIARDFLLDDRPDIVVVVVDAANLERNLYLVVQLLEMGVPTVVALNMIDAATDAGIAVDAPRLAALLGAPVVPMSARSGRGVDGLGAAVDGAGSGPLVIDYGPEVEAELERLSRTAVAVLGPGDGHLGRWLALALLEGDADVAARAGLLPGGPELVAAAEAAGASLVRRLDEEPDTLVADGRYGWIHAVVRETVRRPDGAALTPSERIDRVLTHRVLGLPIFLGLMWAVFRLTADVSRPYLDWIDGAISGPASAWASAAFAAAGLGGTWLESLAVDGALAGVGGVLVFVPVLGALYLVLSVLEDSGYMARAAFVMDRPMRAIGLHGKSFLPLLLGFGCNVPAIYATRTLRHERDRVITGLLVPFMSCGARLPVYVLFAAIFFPAHAGTIVFGLYLVGIVTAAGVAVVLDRTVFRGTAASPFVMELPAYRMPTVRAIGHHVRQRTGAFVRKAWTIILAMSVLVWLVMAIPGRSGASFGAVPIEDSLFARAAGAASPVFAPLGFGDWRATGALATGLVAKEVVVSTLAQTHRADEAAGGGAGTAGAAGTGAAGTPRLASDLAGIARGFVTATVDTVRSVPLVVGVDLRANAGAAAPSRLSAALAASFEEASGGHGRLAALAFMVFILLYTPCMVVVAAERHELGTRWMWMSVVGQLALAWTAGMVVYQAGRALGWG